MTVLWRKIKEARGLGDIGEGVILDNVVRGHKVHVCKEKKRSNHDWERIG